MGQPYIGEIRMFAGEFAPVGWELCDGRVLPIAENDALFNLVGTTYGGDGVETFGLPDLRGRMPLGQGAGPGLSQYSLGESAGTETVTLTVGNLPAHRHTAMGAAAAPDTPSPVGAVWASRSSTPYTAVPVATNPMNATTIGPTGGSQAHDNVAPYLAVTFIIALFGIYPS